jgi:hypothetical protein
MLSDIEKISIKDHARGALEGAGVGAGSGALIGYIDGDDKPSSKDESNRSLKIEFKFSAETKALGGALGGGCIGLLGGAIIGHTLNYHFSSEPPMKSNLPINTAISQKFIDNNRRVEVTSVQRGGGNVFIIEFQGKTIRLHGSHVKMVQRIDDKVYLWVSEDTYISKLKGEE